MGKMHKRKYPNVQGDLKLTVEKVIEPSLNVESRKTWEETWGRAKESRQRVWGPHLHLIERLSKPKKGQILLEPGSGTGLTSLFLAKKHSMKAILLDYSKNVLLIARKNARDLKVGVNLILGDLKNIPLKDEVCDLVWNDGVNEHFEGPERQTVFNEMARLAKDGGKVIVLVPNQSNILYYVNRKILEATGRWDVGYERAFTPSELCVRMKRSGLRIVATAGDNPLFSLIQILNSIRGRTMSPAKGEGGTNLVSFIEKVEMVVTSKNLLNFYVGGRIAICGSTYPKRDNKA